MSFVSFYITLFCTFTVLAVLSETPCPPPSLGAAHKLGTRKCVSSCITAKLSPSSPNIYDHITNIMIFLFARDSGSVEVVALPWYCETSSCRIETAKWFVIAHKFPFSFEKWILWFLFCTGTATGWFLLLFSILLLSVKCFYSALLRSFMILVWSLQGNLLLAETPRKSKATVRRVGWMKLQYNNIMLRIMIPLCVSIEIRAASLQCSIFILLTFFILLISSAQILFYWRYPPHQLQNVNTVYKILHLFYHQLYSSRCISSANIKTPADSSGNSGEQLFIFCCPGTWVKCDGVRQLPVTVRFFSSESNWFTIICILDQVTPNYSTKLHNQCEFQGAEYLWMGIIFNYCLLGWF